MSKNSKYNELVDKYLKLVDKYDKLTDAYIVRGEQIAHLQTSKFCINKVIYINDMPDVQEQLQIIRLDQTSDGVIVVVGEPS